jgi:hypothetical protein
MRCIKCGTEATTGKKFCAGCGGPLSICCPKCGVANAPSSGFCEDCGASLTGNVAAVATPDLKAGSTAFEQRNPYQDKRAPLLPKRAKTVTTWAAMLLGIGALRSASESHPYHGFLSPEQVADWSFAWILMAVVYGSVYSVAWLRRKIARMRGSGL